MEFFSLYDSLLLSKKIGERSGFVTFDLHCVLRNNLSLSLKYTLWKAISDIVTHLCLKVGYDPLSIEST